jgi:hypothetical protein
MTFSDTETGARFLCSLDGATAAACTSPHQLTALGDGAHTFSVVARDAAGNVSPAASGSWVVDLTPPPAPRITTGPASVTNSTTAVFQLFDADPSAALTCSLDGAAFVACGPSATYVNVPEGAHTFDVKAADSLGNAASAARFGWTVDLTAPTPPSILTGPGAATNHPVATFTFDAHDAASLECALDSTTAYSACSSPLATGSLAEGSHTLLVRGVDGVGNKTSATPYAWLVDTVPPPAPTVTGPATLTRETSAAFTISDTDPTVTFTCSLDGATASACASGLSLQQVAEGSHTLSVIAVDPARNTATTSYAWTVDATAPSVRVTLPTTLTSSASASFSENVRGVTAASLALRFADPTAAKATQLTCRNGAGAAVSCAAGPVRAATLRPLTLLVPGQHYAVVANPAGDATITDTAGNTLAAKSVAFRAARVVEENSPSVSASWNNVTAASAYGGAYRREHLAGADATYPFTGTSVTWYTVTGPSQGVALVSVDGVAKPAVNNYAATASYRVRRTVGGLAAGAHTLRVVVSGRKGSFRALGTYVALDAIEVGGVRVTNPAFATRWCRTALASASGGHVTAADLPGAAAALSFRGTSVIWQTVSAPRGGKARLYVDGLLKGTYDNWSSTPTFGVRHAVSGLTDAVHTVRLVVLGTHRVGATGSLVVLDRWLVG